MTESLNFRHENFSEPICAGNVKVFYDPGIGILSDIQKLLKTKWKSVETTETGENIQLGRETGYILPIAWAASCPVGEISKTL
jgi:hypothetical protein